MTPQSPKNKAHHIAGDADRVMRKNFPDSKFYETGLADKKKWWHLW